MSWHGDPMIFNPRSVVALEIRQSTLAPSGGADTSRFGAGIGSALGVGVGVGAGLGSGVGFGVGSGVGFGVGYADGFSDAPRIKTSKSALSSAIVSETQIRN